VTRPLPLRFLLRLPPKRSLLKHQVGRLGPVTVGTEGQCPRSPRPLYFPLICIFTRSCASKIFGLLHIVSKAKYLCATRPRERWPQCEKDTKGVLVVFYSLFRPDIHFFETVTPSVAAEAPEEAAAEAPAEVSPCELPCSPKWDLQLYRDCQNSVVLCYKM